MRLAKAALALMSLHAVAALLLLPRGVSAGYITSLQPLMSSSLIPFVLSIPSPMHTRWCCGFADGECGKVRCGMGSCSESGDYAFGFACRCNPGWSRFSVGDTEFPFLSCVIPNCKRNSNQYLYVFFFKRNSSRMD